MALIRCCECNGKVSDKASTCPKCGAPVSLSIAAAEKKAKDERNGCLGCLGVIALLAFIGWFQSDQNEHGVPFGDRPQPQNSFPVTQPPAFEPPAIETQPSVVNCVLDDPDAVCRFISTKFSAPTTWRESRVVSGEWVISSIGASIEFGQFAEFGQPNVSVFAYGSGAHSVDRVTFKLNMNGSGEYDRMREMLVRTGSEFLKLDDNELSADIRSLIEQAISDSDRSGVQSKPRLLHRDDFEHYGVELHVESGRYTALILHVLRPGTPANWPN